jgi:hypothetical protein
MKIYTLEYQIQPKQQYLFDIVSTNRQDVIVRKMYLEHNYPHLKFRVKEWLESKL